MSGQAHGSSKRKIGQTDQTNSHAKSSSLGFETLLNVASLLRAGRSDATDTSKQSRPDPSIQTDQTKQAEHNRQRADDFIRSVMTQLNQPAVQLNQTDQTGQTKQTKQTQRADQPTKQTKHDDQPTKQADQAEQTGRAAQTAQTTQAGQAGQAGQVGQTAQTKQAGHAAQAAQAAQAGQTSHTTLPLKSFIDQLNQPSQSNQSNRLDRVDKARKAFDFVACSAAAVLRIKDTLAKVVGAMAGHYNCEVQTVYATDTHDQQLAKIYENELVHCQKAYLSAYNAFIDACQTMCDDHYRLTNTVLKRSKYDAFADIYEALQNKHITPSQAIQKLIDMASKFASMIGMSHDQVLDFLMDGEVGVIHGTDSTKSSQSGMMGLLGSLGSASSLLRMLHVL